MSAPLATPEATAAPPLPAAYSWRGDLPRTASTARRTFAFALDCAIVFALAWTMTFLSATFGILRIPDVYILGNRSLVAGLLWLVSIFELPLLLAYFTLFEGRIGRTPGKMIVGLRVQRVDGAKLRVFDGFLRNLLRLLWVTPLGPAFVIVDAWSLHTTELDQRMGDLAAGTIVVDERA